jgi:AcrR family transcriptional regulator
MDDVSQPSAKGEQRRQHLLDAAGRVFGRKPFEEASMQEIAAEAQVDLQGFYDCFPSKQALYEELSASLNQAFLAEARQLAEVSLAPLEELRALTFTLVRHFHDRPAALSVYVHFRFLFDWGMESRFSSLHGTYENGRAQVQRCIAGLAATGRLRPLPPEFLTQLYLDILQACLNYHQRHHHEEVPACVARILDCFLHGAGERS